VSYASAEDLSAAQLEALDAKLRYFESAGTALKKYSLGSPNAIASWASARSPSAHAPAASPPESDNPVSGPSCLVQIVHGSAQHRYRGIAIVAPGSLLDCHKSVTGTRE
jgi:hypothetical protein